MKQPDTLNRVFRRWVVENSIYNASLRGDEDIMKLQNTLNENKANDTINEDSSESALYQRLHDVSDVIERLYKEQTITAATARKMGKLVAQIGKLV